MDTRNNLTTDQDQTIAPSGAEQALEEVLFRARETGTQLSADASRSTAEMRRVLRQNAAVAKDKASDTLLSAAETIRSEALKSNHEEVIRQSRTMARGMEKAALYLDSRSLEQLGDDAREAVRENVWPTLGIVAALGFLVGLLIGGGRRR